MLFKVNYFSVDKGKSLISRVFIGVDIVFWTCAESYIL